jgi:hypothetical protein
LRDIKNLRELRDGVVVVLPIAYALGYLISSVTAIVEGFGLLALLSAQYMLAGVPALAVSVGLVLVFGYLRKLLFKKLALVAATSASREGPSIQLAVGTLGCAALARVVSSHCVNVHFLGAESIVVSRTGIPRNARRTFEISSSAVSAIEWINDGGG